MNQCCEARIRSMLVEALAEFGSGLRATRDALAIRRIDSLEWQEKYYQHCIAAVQRMAIRQGYNLGDIVDAVDRPT